MPQPWSWKVCAFVAVIAVTIDALIVQSLLVWLSAAGVLTLLAQFKRTRSGCAVSMPIWMDTATFVSILSVVVAVGTLLPTAALTFVFGISYSILRATRTYWAQPCDSSMEPLTALLLPFLYSVVLFGRRSLSAYRLI